MSASAESKYAQGIVKRFLGFTTLPLISTLSSLVLLPIVSRMGGVDGWAAIGLGQAVGSFCGIVVSYGWNTVGGARIALAKTSVDRLSIYKESLLTRPLLLMLLAAVSSAILGFNLDYGVLEKLLCITMTVASMITGMSFAWFAVGEGKPSLILKFETIPTVLAMLASAVVIVLTGNLLWYPVGIATGPLIGLLLFHRHILGRGIPSGPPALRDFRRAFVLNGQPALIELAGGLYTAAPVTAAAIAAGVSATAEMTSADKLYRFATMAVMVLGNTLQSWVLETNQRGNRLRRQWIGMSAHLLLGLVGFLGLVFLGPWLTRVAFGSEVAVSQPVLMAYGVVFLLISISTPLNRNVLIPAGKTSTVLVATALAAISSVPAMLIGGYLWGALGVALGFVVSEIAVFAVLAPSAMIELKRERRSGVPNEKRNGEA
ncbi:lipopolysaccharide biosynthesis protein [Pseudoclavibacter sp. CFCC 13611]|uniref:lipopolysaccharide biosynthesis protein n=1 Tax=Pseudoclavibacter sp. CFCC 13611 TaxID=2615178 RepID=UPI001300DEFE|nr:hypothetical protein [Pseudoclavibacter sp. CFCC 13611]KAB1663004.1 hypothetical protein F8O08_10700 [Pseudoclavibacter sp. CFCC 13611]